MNNGKFNGPVIIYGPRGCDKTRNATKLATFFGKFAVVEVDETTEHGVSRRYGKLCFGAGTRSDTLYLTGEESRDIRIALDLGARTMRFDEAMRMMEPML